MSGFGSGANATPIGQPSSSDFSGLISGQSSFPAKSFGNVGGGPVKEVKTGCKKCGYQGHLTFQCRNFVQLDPVKGTLVTIN